MNLLLITFSFPPAGGVGVLRAASLAKYLPSNGLRVDVLTARNAPSVGKDHSLLDQIPEAVTVHHSWTLDLPFALRKRVKTMVMGSSNGKGPAKPAASPAFSFSGVLRRALGNLLLPDPQVGWLPFAYPAAKRIIRSRKIDAVMVTAPPFSSVRLVSKLRREFPSLPIVVDFRDEWLGTSINMMSFNNNQRARTVATKTESDAVHAANAVVLVTEAARRELIKRYPHEPASKFHCIPNGFETKQAATEPHPSHAHPEDIVRITYIGSIYRSTDPGTFVEAIRELDPKLRARLRVRLIGHIESPESREALSSLGETISLEGFIPQAEALKALDHSDYLLLIAHDMNNVSAKFYDYLSGTKPVLGLLHPDCETRRLMDETRAGVWADVRDSKAIGQLLVSIIEGDLHEHPLVRNEQLIATYHRSALAHRYADLLLCMANSRMQ